MVVAGQLRICKVVSPLRGEWIEISAFCACANPCHVSPLRGEWIEIALRPVSREQVEVSPLRGEWIEIEHFEVVRRAVWSRLSEASGLKC